MPIGSKGERRPANPIEAGIMVARVAVGDIDEEYAEKLEPKPNRDCVPRRRNPLAAKGP